MKKFYILRLARKHLPWMASAMKLLYYVVKLTSEAVNYNAQTLRAQI